MSVGKYDFTSCLFRSLTFHTILFCDLQREKSQLIKLPKICTGIWMCVATNIIVHSQILHFDRFQYTYTFIRYRNLPPQVMDHHGWFAYGSEYILRWRKENNQNKKERPFPEELCLSLNFVLYDQPYVLLVENHFIRTPNPKHNKKKMNSDLLGFH